MKNKESVGLKGVWKVTIRDAETNKIKRTYEFLNIVPTVARTMIANNFSNVSPTNTMLINYFAVGSGTTAVANGDTTLETETYRNALASRTSSSNIVYATGFISATEDSGTYYEAGIFSDATGSADSGILVSHVLLNAPTGITKSLTESLTIDWTLIIS